MKGGGGVRSGRTSKYEAIYSREEIRKMERGKATEMDGTVAELSRERKHWWNV